MTNMEKDSWGDRGDLETAQALLASAGHDATVHGVTAVTACPSKG